MPSGPVDFLRKLGAIVLVLSSVTSGMIGLFLLVDRGNPWGLACMAATPLGIWVATRLTPEGGTTGYFDQNI